MFKKKRVTSGKEFIVDGIKQVQLYVCPSCQSKVESKGTEHCKICGIALCIQCEKRILIMPYTFNQKVWFFCEKHLKWFIDEAEQLISMKQRDKTE